MNTRTDKKGEKKNRRKQRRKEEVTKILRTKDTKRKKRVKPKKEPKLGQFAKLAHLQQLSTHMQNQFVAFKKEATGSMTQTYENHKAIADGLDSAEFNLRAHQKVLNALALDMYSIHSVVNNMAATLNTPLDKTGAEGEEESLYKDVLVRNVRMVKHTNEDSTVEDRVDWGFYHAQVDEEMKIRIKKREEMEAAIAAEQEKKKVAEKMEELKKIAKDAGNDPEEVEREANKLLEKTHKVATELGKKVRGQEFDQVIIDDAQEMIDDDEKKHPEGASVFGG